jgi:hypothetical protein
LRNKLENTKTGKKMNREKLFTQIITQISKGHESEYESLAREIDKREEKQLIPQYQEALDKIGENPTEEPELFKLIEEAAARKISQFEIAAKVLGDAFNDVDDTEQVALLIKRVTDKIILFRDADGVVKKTKAFESYEPMKPVDRLAFEKMQISIEEEKNEAKKEKQSKKLDEYIADKCNVNINDLTKWEKGLLAELLAQEARGISDIFLGKK